MTVGNLGALKQTNVKRMLAYSSIRARRIPAGRVHGVPTGTASARQHPSTSRRNYSAMNVGAFAVITQITGYTEHTRTIEDFYRSRAASSVDGCAAGAFFLLSLIGIPFTGGFFDNGILCLLCGGHPLGGGHWRSSPLSGC